MKLLPTILILFSGVSLAKTHYPLNETVWDIQAQNHVFETHHNFESVKIDKGMAILKGVEFFNGTIEFDVFLPPEQAFPGIRFRGVSQQQMESFFMRPHLTGKPDANQAAPVVGGLTAWQLYFGPTYSFPYEYKFDAWTHVKLVVNDDKAQVFLDHAQTPHLSWYLKHKPQAGVLAIGGGFAPAHYANFTVDTQATALVDFAASRVPLSDTAIKKWRISDKFLETDLTDVGALNELIQSRSWPHWATEEERGLANISWNVDRYGSDGDTVFARVDVISESDQLKTFRFGYSDRAVLIFNGKPIYKGTKKWRSRDYRYLGTAGFFDSVFLPLKQGKNTLLLAVTEEFGGWLVGGEFADNTGLKISE